jgi:hypothetical protein
MAPSVFPVAISALIREGKLAAAAQRVTALLRSSSETQRAALALEMALAWAEADEAHLARRWLAKVPVAAPGVDALRLARLGERLCSPLLAHQWYERWYERWSEGAPDAGALSDVDRLQHGRVTLALAQRMRLRHGRQGSWQQHLGLLERARGLLDDLAAETPDTEIARSAASAAARAARLLGSKGR